MKVLLICFMRACLTIWLVLTLTMSCCFKQEKSSKYTRTLIIENILVYATSTCNKILGICPCDNT